MELFNKGQIAALLPPDSANPQGKAVVDFLRTQLGLDARKDLTSLTLYGEKYGDQDAVAIIRGNLNAPAIEGLLKLNAAYEATPCGNRVLHKWTEKERSRPAVLCFTDDKCAVLSSSIEKVQAAIDVVDGKTETQATRATLEGLESPGVFLLISAKKPVSSLGGADKAMILQHTDRMTLSFAETAGAVNGVLRIVCDSPDNAAQIEQVIRGMIAFATLASDQNPTLAEVTKAMAVSTERAAVTVKMSNTSQAVADFMKAQRRRGQGKAMPQGGGAPGASPSGK